MKQLIRAKFRCLQRTEHWDNRVELKLAPVMPRKCAGHIEEDGAEENEAFWKASPSGELILYYFGEAPYKPDVCYYIDLERIEGDPKPDERSWELIQVAQSSTHMDLKFNLEWKDEPGLRSATFTLGIDNELAWSAFVGHQGSTWRVTITEAT